MANFKKLTDEELAKLNPIEQVKYQANLQAFEEEQAKDKAEAETKAKEEADKKAEADKKTKAEAKASGNTSDEKEEVADSNYLDKKEIEELKKNNPTLKEFFATSDKVAFPNKWLAENHNRNRKAENEPIQHIKI